MAVFFPISIQTTKMIYNVYYPPFPPSSNFLFIFRKKKLSSDIISNTRKHYLPLYSVLFHYCALIAAILNTEEHPEGNITNIYMPTK